MLPLAEVLLGELQFCVMKNKKNVFLFPGQGAQYPGMGQEFFLAFPRAKEIFQEADDRLKIHLTKIIFEGPEPLLTETRYSQLAIFVTSVAILKVVMDQFPILRPSITAGLSLGEYSALVAAEKIPFQEALFLVKERAHFMHEACEKTKGTMAAILGLSAEEVDSCLKGAQNVWVANYNCPGQIVISGTLEGVEKGSLLLKEKGAKRVVPLTVHGAFHSPLMQSAQDQLIPYIEKAHFLESDIQLVSNVTGKAVGTILEMKKCLQEQVTHSVRWEQGISSMGEVSCFIEMGCGKTLSGMNRKIGVSAPTISIEKPSDLEEIHKLCHS